MENIKPGTISRSLPDLGEAGFVAYGQPYIIIFNWLFFFPKIFVRVEKVSGAPQSRVYTLQPWLSQRNPDYANKLEGLIPQCDQ